MSFGDFGIGGLETFQEEVLNFSRGDGTPKFNPFFIPKMIADIAPGNISIKMDSWALTTLQYLLVRLQQMQ